MVDIIYRPVISPVISHKERPSPILAVIGCAGMKDVTMKEDGVTGLTLSVYQRTGTLDVRNALRIRAHLISDTYMIYASAIV